MSENIPPDEVKRRLIIFLRIPAEVWTDVLKLFPRRTLVQKITPVCYRLKEISDKNVKTIHVIKNAHQFTYKLKCDDPEANAQIEQLAANKCKMASQFRISYLRIFEQNKAILRHCIELFHGCRLGFYPYTDETLAHFNECLTYLGPAKPFVIYICLFDDPQFLHSQCLHHPTIWNCNHIKLTLSLPFQSVDAMAIALTILDWLHHQQPIGVEDDSGDDAEPVVRCFIHNNYYEAIQGVIDWLINACIQNIQRSQGPEDRCRFVLKFSAANRDQNTLLDQFERRHNQATGEVLLLELDDDADQIATMFHLRRCLAEEADNGREFYEKLFKQNSGTWDEFVVNDGPMVGI